MDRRNTPVPDRRTTTPPAGDRPAVVLAVDSQEWTMRSLESVLAPRGFAFVRAFSARQAMELIDQVRPDVVVAASRLSDGPVTGLLAAIRERAELGNTLPVTVLQAGAESRDEAAALFDAGAWAVLQPPVQADLLGAQLGAFVRARRDIDRYRERDLVDPETGFYSINGLRRRAQEIAAETYRTNGTLSCLAIDFSRSAISHSAANGESTKSMAEALRRMTRRSDIAARVGPEQFAIVVSTSSATGTETWLERIREELRHWHSMETPVRVSMVAATRYRESFTPVEELLDRAVATLAELGESSTSPTP